MPRMPVRQMLSMGTEWHPGEEERVTDTAGEYAFTVERSRDAETAGGLPVQVTDPSRYRGRGRRVRERVTGRETAAAQPTALSGPVQPWIVKQK